MAAYFSPLLKYSSAAGKLLRREYSWPRQQAGGRGCRVHAQRLVQVVDGQGAFQVGRGQADADEGLQRAVVAFQVIAEFLGGLPFFILQQQNEAELDGRLRPLAEMGVAIKGHKGLHMRGQQLHGDQGVVLDHQRSEGQGMGTNGCDDHAVDFGTDDRSSAEME